MKLIQLIFPALIWAILANMALAQPQVPNAGFEEWESQTSPKIWDTSNKFGESFGFISVTQTEDKHSGNYALMLTTVDTQGWPAIPGVACLGTLGLYEVSGGLEFSGRPLKLRGYYKHPSTGDTAIVIVQLLKNGKDSAKRVAGGQFRITEKKGEYEYFECPINYYSEETPELLNIILMTSDMPGSTLIVDDLEFVYKGTGTGPDKTGSLLRPSVYPNPAGSEVNFKFDNQEQRQILIYDEGFNEIMNLNYGGELFSLDIKGYAPGFYFYLIRSENKEFTGKFIIEK